MNVYRQLAPKYWQNGFITIPCEGKAPKVLGWQKWPEDIDAQREKINQYISLKPNSNIGLVLGDINKVVAVDIDVTDEAFLNDLLDLIPYSMYTKKGKKGITLFYEYAGNKSQKSTRYAKGESTYQLEILSTGNQTVLPPSIHPDTKTPYFWVSEKTLENERMPDVDLTRINNEEIFNIFYQVCKKHKLKPLDKNKGEGGRNEKLKNIVVSMLARGEKLSKIVSEIIDVDQLHDVPLFEDDTEKIKGTDPKNKAEIFVRNIKKSLDSNKVDLKPNDSFDDSGSPDERAESDESKKLKTNYIIFEKFFNSDLEGSIREKLSGEFKKKDDMGYWQPVISGLRALKSRAHSKGLNHNLVEMHLAEYISNQPYGLLIKPEKWDGKERMLQIFTHFKFSKEGLDADYCWPLFKEWCANIFRRIDNPMSQNRILIFRGAQGIGKDYFIENVIGKALGPYFVNLEPQESNKENFIAIHGKLLANISEFDQTNRMAISSIKNLITSSNQRIRMPYEPAAKDYRFHCSFFASCNFDSVLRDSSGNRRFLIFDIESIHKDYDRFVESAQILAEMHQWFLDDFRAPKECYDALGEFIQQETPDNVDDTALELSAKMIEQVEKIKTSKVEYSDIKEGISSIAKHLGISVFRVQNAIKRNGLQKRTKDLRYYTASEYLKSKSVGQSLVSHD